MGEARQAEPQLRRLDFARVLATHGRDDIRGSNAALQEADVAPVLEPLGREQIAAIIGNSARPHEVQTRELLELYEKLVEAIHLLSTPPDASKVAAPSELSALLSERLDAIYALATKTMETTSLVKPRQSEE